MRRNKRNILLFLVLITSFSCEKVPFDYRNKYIGDYNFTTYYTEWSWATGMYTYDTTEYNGKTVYGTTKELLKIDYQNNKEIELFITRNGELYSIEFPSKVGEVRNDTLNWGYTIQYDGNSRSWVRIVGVKKK
jgi:hypothetical protein